jgi:hypothetical protein
VQLDDLYFEVLDRFERFTHLNSLPRVKDKASNSWAVVRVRVRVCVCGDACDAVGRVHGCVKGYLLTALLGCLGGPLGDVDVGFIIKLDLRSVLTPGTPQVAPFRRREELRSPFLRATYTTTV